MPPALPCPALPCPAQAAIETYGTAPEIMVSGDVDLHIPYIPAHLDYMLFELLKNSVRAVVELAISAGGAGGLGVSARLPPVLVRVCNAQDEATIRCAGWGGGS